VSIDMHRGHLDPRPIALAGSRAPATSSLRSILFFHDRSPAIGVPIITSARSSAAAASDDIKGLSAACGARSPLYVGASRRDAQSMKVRHGPSS